MGKSRGYRARTRDKFTKPFRQNGCIKMKNYLEKMKVGEFVDIIVDGAIQRGMPHLFYHGRTGRIFNVGPKSLGVVVNKEVRNRMIAKKLNIRREHLRKSNCRTAFIERIKVNDALKKQAKIDGKIISTKRQPVLPRGQVTVDLTLGNLKVNSMTPYLVIH